MQKYCICGENARIIVLLYVICTMISRMYRLIYISIIVFVAALCGCGGGKPQTETTPWGTVVGDTAAEQGRFSLDDIVAGGEIIVATLSGQKTYYEYHGRILGDQYMLCERFAQHIGVAVRAELCADTVEMIAKLLAGDVDMVVCPLSESAARAGDMTFLKAGDDSKKEFWTVRKDSRELAEAVNGWYKPTLLADVRREQDFLFSTRSVKRKVYSPMLNRASGVISHYDGYFRQYARQAGMDWRLMAAQCYQESCFDPNAVSWAGARGLMQIMPTTADHLGLARSMMNNPEANIAASSRYMAELAGKFRDVPSAEQRMYFALACYNGGYHHIRDAMALVRKNGGNQYSWDEVSKYVLRLSDPVYYRDPVVKYGYMRGSETVDYVAKIRSRYEQYRGMTGGGGAFGIGRGGDSQTPHRATHKHKYKI